MKSKINCNNIQINALLDDELSLEIKNLSLQHIKNCKKCQSIYNQLKQVNTFLGMYTNQNPNQSLINSINQIPAKNKIKIFKYSKIAVAASVIISILSSAFLFNQSLNNNSTDEEISVFENYGLYSALGE